MTNMWTYIILLLNLLLVGSEAVILFPVSPCPQVFTYEDVSTEGDRWYGELKFTLASSVTGVTLRFTLDRQAQLFVSWEGPVLSNDNRLFIVFNTTANLEGGTELQHKIMVKFNPSFPVPFLQTIHFNGQRICPPDTPLTLTVGGGGEGGVSTPRPDFEFPEPVDVLTDVFERTKTSTSTTESLPNSNSNDSNYACGLVDMVTPLITHGMSAQKGQWPWHVALYKTEGVNLNYKCGATLVSRNKVITAAHCVTNGGIFRKPVNASQLVLYLGKHRLNHFVENGVQTRQVSKITVHPNYDSNTYYADLAILTLSEKVDYTNYVRPVCIWPSQSIDGISDIEGKEGTVVGWGLDENEQTTENLKVAKLPVVSTETCLRSYPQFYSQFTSNATFCAGFRNGTSPCNGDSGGGIVFKRDSTWYIRGIVSLSVAKEGLNFCDPRYYVIFTDISKFNSFIQRNV